MKLDVIYQKLPVFLQNMACSFYGWREKRVRFNADFHQFLAQYKKTEFSSKAQIQDSKQKALNQVFKSAIEDVQYYRNKFPTINPSADSNFSFDDLKQLPLLTKEDIRNNLTDLLSSQYDTDALQEYHTSGTTGKALTFYKSPKAVAMQWAIWFRHRNRFDCQLGDLHVNFTGKQVVPSDQSKAPYWRFNAPLNQYLINMQHITPNKIADIVDFLNTIKPKFYSGYPSIIAEVARLALEHDLKLTADSKPKYIFGGAENTLDYQKQALESWTDATVTDQYGLTEGNCNMSRCEFGNYHEDFEFCHIECIEPEVLDDGCIRGRLIGTAFTNPAMPLIRYDTGDIAIWYPQDYQCPCGRHSAVIKSIDGRIDDAVRLPDGRRIMRFDYIFKGTDSIREAQVCQYKEGEVVIKVVVRKNYNATVEATLKESFSQWICADTKVLIEQVESIERSASGKFRAVRSFL
ncbi:MAG: hypothetical protein MJK04_04310 [Psychrosphaera sp.]|nr:hypothetical protein [Psychrosphaera sp.]